MSDVADDWAPVKQAGGDDWTPVAKAAPDPAPVPEAFLNRVRAGTYLTGDIGGAMPEAHADFFKTFEGAQLKGAWDMFTLPGRVKSGETRLDTEAGMNEAVGMGVGIALGRMNEAVGNGHGAPVIDQGNGRFARPFTDEAGKPQVAPIGNLPRPEDFTNAGKVLDSPHAEANLKQLWQDEGIHPAEAVHDAERDAFLKNDITARHEEIKLDPENEQVLTENGGHPNSLSAAVSDPPDVSLRIQPASPPGSLSSMVQSASEKLFDIGRDIQMKLTPMARGSVDSMATVKDYMNSMRRNEWDLSRTVTDIEKRFSPEDWSRMFNAMEEESLSRRLGEPDEMRQNQGLATLPPEQRALLLNLDSAQQLVWLRLRDAGRVTGDGVPFHVPRMVLNIPKSEMEGAMPLDAMGYDLRTRAPGMRQRKYMELEETERAAKAKYGEQAVVARDIRALPIAIKQLEDALAGSNLVDHIKEVGDRIGEKTVQEGGKKPEGWFTLDHPAFKKYRPMLEEVDGKMQAITDSAGDAVMEDVPIHVRGDFEGPLRSAMWGKSGETYQAMMALKGKTMSYIMNSPMIHNMVELGRALPVMRTRIIKAYVDGNRVKQDPAFMHDAIAHGLVPIGKRFFNQDISSVMEAPNLTPGRSMEAQILAAVPGLFDQAAGTAVKQAVDKMGNFWHNTLLWDRIADLQAGIYKIVREDQIAKGKDPNIAAYTAAHYANRYAGALPKEAMSEAATKISNFMFFSRSFTFGNLGVMKDMFTGLPKDVLAQIERDAGFKAGSIEGSGEEGAVQQAVTSAKSMARRKAMSVVGLDIALAYVGNSLLQNGFNVMLGDSSWSKEGHDYLRRMWDTLNDVKVHPLSLLNPFYIPEHLSATSENEPGKSDRTMIGRAKDGTAIYARNPVGKIGEEFSNYFGSPLDMLRKKEGTMMRPLMQLFSNDAGFGRKIYDTTDNTPPGVWNNAVLIAKHLAGSQLPMGQIRAGIDLVKGEGDKLVNELQAFGPFAGVTFSRGAPGGPAVGEMYANKSAFEFRVQQAMPDIRKQILRGDKAGALQVMEGLGMDASYSRWVVKTTENPATRLSAKSLRDFYRTSTPEQRARMERDQRTPQPYAGPNLGPLAQ